MSFRLLLQILASFSLNVIQGKVKRHRQRDRYKYLLRMNMPQPEPAYIAIMMLNPVESAIRDFEEPVKHLNLEEGPLVPGNNNRRVEKSDQSDLVPKQKCSILISMMITISAFASWFTFTTANPMMQLYYDKSLEIVFLFMTVPIVTAVASPILHKLFQKSTNHLLFLMLAAFANALGSAIKCKGTGQDGYIIVLFGQLTTSFTIPIALHFMYAIYKQSTESKYFIIILAALAVGIGSCVGTVVPCIMISTASNIATIGWDIYKYFMWNAVIAVVCLILIPFSIKEQKEHAASTYQYEATRVVDTHSGNHDTEEDITMDSICSFNYQLSSLFRCKELLIRVSAVSFGYGLSMSLFLMTSSWIPNKVNSCIAQSCVIATCFLFVFLTRFLKGSYLKWLQIILGIISISSTIVFAIFHKKASLQAVLVTLYYLLHSASCFQSIMLFQKLMQCHFLEHYLTLSFVINLFASMACIIVGVAFWKLGIMGWAVVICAFCLCSVFLSVTEKFGTLNSGAA